MKLKIVELVGYRPISLLNWHNDETHLFFELLWANITRNTLLYSERSVSHSR